MIVRIGCLYGIHREKSFIHKLLRNLCRSYIQGKRQVYVSKWQKSTPTSTKFVCDNVVFLLQNNLPHGTFTLSPRGIASRYDFAYELTRIMKDRNMLEKLSEMEILPNNDEVKYLPSTSEMNLLDKTSHLGASKGTWEMHLEDFIVENSESLKNFIVKTMKEEAQNTERESKN